MGRGVVPELDHQRMTLQRGLDDPSLHAASPAVHETDFVEPRGCRSRDLFVNDRGNIARRERMKVELSLDGNVMHAASPLPLVFGP